MDVAEFSVTGGVAESLAGPRKPAFFTGFSDVGRKSFQALNGFDPLELFDRASAHFWQSDSTALETFYRYRVEVSNRLLRTIMGTLDSLRRADGRPWELLLTVLDNLPHPEVERLLATDLRAIRSIARDTGFLLQVEDLASEWSRPPGRYALMGRAYRDFLEGRPFLIDINVVPAHPAGQRGFATAQPAGTEVARQWEAASRYAKRVCFYAENSLFEDDWEMLPYTAASPVTVRPEGRGLRVTVPSGGELLHHLPGRSWTVDGRPWPAAGDVSLLLPRGEHLIEAADRPPGTLRLLDISGDLLDCSATGSALALEYEAEMRCAVTVAGRPARVHLDGAEAALPVVPSGDRSVILAPAGRHTLRCILPGAQALPARFP